MTNSKKKRTRSIPTRLDEDVCKELARIGHFDETRSDVIRRVLAMHKRGRNSTGKYIEYCPKCGWVDWFNIICPQCKHDKRTGVEY